MWSLFTSLILLPVAFAADAQVFKIPSPGPAVVSANLGGGSNSTLPKSKVVPGKVFDRFIQIWLENTDFNVAKSSPTFMRLAQQGITLSNYAGLTHPSEPNYVAATGGDFWGMHDDDLYNIPSNVSTIVDLLEAKNISWTTYQEGMLTDGDPSFNSSAPNYLNASAPPYVYYVRKHNPLIIYNSIAEVPARAALNRNFNDFAADYNASALPQWIFVTPNLVNDAHDTTVDFAGQWLDFWLQPLLSNPRFNDNRTLILLTFDENESFNINNQIFSLLLGGAVPKNLHGTSDNTYYTHYSSLSTVESNWGLGCLGRGDTNKTLANVFSFVANATGYKNTNVSGAAIPLTNATGNTPGPLNPDLFIPFAPPNVNAVCPDGGKVFVAAGVNTTITTPPPPVNLTAQNQTVPAGGPAGATPTSPGSPGASATKPASGGARKDAVSIAAVVLGAAMVAVELCA